MNESDIILLINYLHGLPQRLGPINKLDEYRALLTDRQRNFIIEALRSYHPR